MDTVFVITLMDEDGNELGVQSVCKSEETADRRIKEIESSTKFSASKKEMEVE